MKQQEEPSNLKRNLTVVACLAVIAGAAVYLGRFFFQRTDHIVGVYYFDLNTKKIFIGPANAWAPIETPSGTFENEPAGVRIFLFSCAPCPKLDGKTLDEAKALGASTGWLEKYRPESKKLLEAGDRKPETIMEGLQLRAFGGTRWLSPSGREALAVRETASRMCSGAPGAACNPE